MANRDPNTGPVVFKLPTLDQKVIPVIYRRFPGFKGRDYDSHYQVSFIGHGYADVVRINGEWRTLVYYPGGKYRCTGGVHKKYKDAIGRASELLNNAKVTV